MTVEDGQEDEEDDCPINNFDGTKRGARDTRHFFHTKFDQVSSDEFPRAVPRLKLSDQLEEFTAEKIIIVTLLFHVNEIIERNLRFFSQRLLKLFFSIFFLIASRSRLHVFNFSR